jgi:p-cumate 2,3-dioxygenase beta subunit
MTSITHTDVERFFYEDAHLLDTFQFDAWLARLTDDYEYIVPAIDRPNGSIREATHLVYDNLFRTRMRVRHLRDGDVVAEAPLSRTRRLVTNVRSEIAGTEARGFANFAIHRLRHGNIDCFLGAYEFDLRSEGEKLVLRRRHVTLDNEGIRPHGQLAIVL